jgi:lysozyme
LLKKLNERDYSAACGQFLVWNKGKVEGKLVVLPGLKKRRAKEAQLFSTPDDVVGRIVS